MELLFRFRISDAGHRNGINHFPVTSLDDFWKIEKAIESGDKNLSLVHVSLDTGEREMKSRITENWTIDGLKTYMGKVYSLGQPYFSYCELMNSRNPDGFEPPEEFNSFADAGNAVAERYFGVPEGGLKYIMATKLAKDIMNGEGPAELPESLSIFTGPDGEPIYMIDSPEQKEIPFSGMSCQV